MTGRTRLCLQGAIATLAAASALAAVFDDMQWLFPVAGGILLVAAVNELTRRTPIAAAAGPVLAANAVLLYVTALDTGSSAYAYVFPTRGSLTGLADLARSGFTDIRTLAAPVPTHRGLVLLAIVGLSAVELVVDLIAVTLRRAAAAGLPLLAVFALCTSVAKGGVGWLPFGIATAGYLSLLLADSRERISRWGRTLGVDPSSRPRVSWADTDKEPSPLSALGRRIGATAIAVGVVVPMVIPGLHGGLPKSGPGGGNGAGHGSSQVVTLNPIVNIRAQLNSPRATAILHMTTTDFSPSYLRLTSLDRFDGTTFSPSTLVAGSRAKVSKGIAAPAVTGTQVQTSVKINSLSVHWLPLPIQVVSPLEVKGDWRYDAGSNTVFSAKTDTDHLSYTTASIRYEPTAAQLDTAGFAARGDVPSTYLDLPAISTRIVSLAQTITAKAPSAFGKALAIQSYLTSPPFRYDTSVPASDSVDALEQFLFQTKAGFCQQYAASMAVLARIVGIPSRVAVGFTHGVLQKDGTWLVTTHDAHAWPELYFPGFGWLPFEPTPRTDGQAIAPAFTRVDPATNQNDVPSKRPTPQPTSTGSHNPIDRRNLDNDTPARVTAPKAKPPHRAELLWWLVPALLALALPLPGLARAYERRRRWHSTRAGAPVAHAGWAELRATAIDNRIDWVDGITPRAVARLIVADAGLDPDARAALDRLVRAEERARYAVVPDQRSVAELHADVTLIGHAMSAGQPMLRRLTTAVWPRSTMLQVRRVVSAFADALDYLDVAGARLRAALRRLRPRTA